MSRRHAVLVQVGEVALVAVGAATLFAIDDGDGFGFIDGAGPDYPLASTIISGTITTILVIAIFFVVRRQRAAKIRVTP